MVTFIAWAGDRYPFDQPEQRQRFDHMMQEFRCLVCQNEDLASSDAKLADDLRQKMYQMVKAGKSDQAIKDYMVSRYGDFVLFKPGWNKLTYVLWMAPFLLLLLGFVVLLLRGRSK